MSDEHEWDGLSGGEDSEIVNAILPEMRALLAAEILTIVERIAKRHHAVGFAAGQVAALEDAADLIDRGPQIPLPPSIYSALCREWAEDARATELSKES